MRRINFLISLCGMCFAALCGEAQEILIQTVPVEGRMPYLKEVARFYNTFYRQAPYFYDASEEAWDGYIRTYFDQPDSVLSLAVVDNRVVAIAIGTPLAHATLKYKGAFIERSCDLNSLFYLGELLVRPGYEQSGVDLLLYGEFERQVVEKKKFLGICKWLLQDEEQQSKSFFWPQEGFSRTEISFEEFWKDTFGKEKVPHTMVCWKKNFPLSSP